MRVLSICDISPNKFGSFEEFLVELTNKLKNTGFEHVIIFREKPIKDVEEALLNLGAKLKIIKPSRHKIHNFITFYKVIKEVRPDIVHFHFYPIYTIVNHLKFIFNIKIVYTDHMGGRQTKSSLKKILHRIYYRINSILFDSGIDKIIGVSNFVKFKYSKEYNIHSNKLCVIYNGININRFQKKIDTITIKKKYNITDEFIISCISLRKDKGAYCLIKAAPNIIKHIPNVKFILVGEGECKKYLEGLIEELNIKDYVVFAGIVPDIADIYGISSCVAMPSIFEEACPFTALESMALGVPVVAFDSGGTKEVVIDGETGYIVPQNSEILADSIVKLYKNGKRIVMGENGEKLIVDKYLIEDCVCKYMEVYSSLLESK